MRNIKTCVVCGRNFADPPSTKRVTCSRVCSTIRKRQSHLGVSNQWSDAARRRQAANGQTANLALGSQAAHLSPVTGPYETNRNALDWHLIDPLGVHHHVHNLALYARRTQGKTWRRWLSGIYGIKQWMIGNRPRQVSQYKGWTLHGAK